MAAFGESPEEQETVFVQKTVVTTVDSEGRRVKGKATVERIGGDPSSADDAGEENESTDEIWFESFEQ